MNKRHQDNSICRKKRQHGHQSHVKNLNLSAMTIRRDLVFWTSKTSGRKKMCCSFHQRADRRRVQFLMPLKSGASGCASPFSSNWDRALFRQLQHVQETARHLNGILNLMFCSSILESMVILTEYPKTIMDCIGVYYEINDVNSCVHSVYLHKDESSMIERELCWSYPWFFSQSLKAWRLSLGADRKLAG